MPPRNPLHGPKVKTKGSLTVRDANGRNPAFVPTDAQRKMVRTMAAYGTPTEQIRAVLDISHVTLKKYFRRELEIAAPEANAQVAQALFYEATKGRSVPAMQFWLKMRARDQWRESAQHHEHVHDFRNAPVEDLERELLAIRSRKRIAAGAGALAATVSDEPDGILD